LTRALFEAFDVKRANRLTAVDLQQGLQELLREEEDADAIPADWVVVGLAKKICRELAKGEYITRDEFERRAAEAYMGLQQATTEEEEEAAA
jgi:hypothetical protein